MLLFRSVVIDIRSIVSELIVHFQLSCTFVHSGFICHDKATRFVFFTQHAANSIGLLEMRKFLIFVYVFKWNCAKTSLGG